jgi:hypothetical protein
MECCEFSKRCQHTNNQLGYGFRAKPADVSTKRIDSVARLSGNSGYSFIMHAIGAAHIRPIFMFPYGSWYIPLNVVIKGPQIVYQSVKKVGTISLCVCN